MSTTEPLAGERTLTDEEQVNLAAVHRWNELYNGDNMTEFVTSCYHPDMTVMIFDGTAFDGGRDVLLSNHSQFIECETFIKSTFPGRRFEIERAIPAGDVVAVEAVLLDDARPDFRYAWCTFLTFRDGLIISDRNYLNHREWPGLLAVMGQE